MRKERKLRNEPKNPRVRYLAVLYVFCVCALAGAILVAALGGRDRTSAGAILLYAAATLLLGCSVYTLVRYFPALRLRLRALAEKYEFTDKLLNRYGYRTIIFAIGSLAVGTLYALFNGAIALINGSVWYAALAVYYILLASMRGGIVFHHGKNRKRDFETAAEKELRATKTYRACGTVLIFLPLCLSGAVTQMVLSRKPFDYADLTVYAAAAYTLYKVVMSVVNLFKARKSDDLTVRAVRNINFADALVSVLALQTAMLRALGVRGVYNAVTGGIVCALTVLMGVAMVIVGNRKIMRLHAASANENAPQDRQAAR